MSATSKWLGLVVAAAVALPAGAGVAFAADPSKDDIVKALNPTARITRGLSAAPRDTARTTEDQQFIDTLRNRASRSLTAEERSRIDAIAKDKPSIDLEINFEFNSAVVGPKAASQIKTLGEALKSADLSGRTFVLAGHTDAVGDPNYNQNLSEQRSDAVKKYLVDNYGIDASQLLTVGLGKSRPKLPSKPYAAVNRRVQVVNVTDK